MIIEDLIRLGKPLLAGIQNHQEVLNLLSDAGSLSTKNFYRHVIVVEIAEEIEPFASHQVWGQELHKDGRKKADFMPDVKRAISAPFVLPQGGNPIHPQGFYVTAYPCYDKHLKAFFESSQKVIDFLDGRLDRTPSLQLTKNQIEQVGLAIHQCVSRDITLQKGEKLLGVLVLADTRGLKSPYYYGDQSTDHDLGRSHIFPEKFIQPNFKYILDLFWQVKVREGAEKGERDGICSICGNETRLVTAYCKSWPWYLPTWTCPLPEGGTEQLMVEGIALCSQCYSGLSYGARLFEKFTRPVQTLITREIFSPVNNREGKNTTARKKISDLPNIRGSGLLLALLDVELGDPDIRSEFAENIHLMLHTRKEGPNLERYIDSVIGFDLSLPEEVEQGNYRLSLIYFSGDPSRGDIHLRAYIEDVVPSTLYQLRGIGKQLAASATHLVRALYPNASARQIGYFKIRYNSIPFLLVRAYGGAYIWDQLQTVLHRQPLALSRPVRNVAERLRSITPRYPDTFNEIREEVIFYLSFIEFLTQYRHKLLKEEGEVISMRSWQELLKVVFETSIEEFQLDSPAELGFACGALMRQFSRQYYEVTEKDYLKQRVLTFGSDLTPETVWKKGLKQILEVAPRFENLKLSDDFRQRVGVVLTEYDRLRQETQTNKDEFMASFWSGYSLQGYNRPKKASTGRDSR